MLRLLVRLHLAISALAGDGHTSPGEPTVAGRVRRLTGCRGQATAEYALVLLGAAALALLVASWAAKTDLVGKLFEFVLGHVIGLVN
jgi:hypothetical protein